MIKGFVFGKFLPFHNGHEAMIQFALQHCDALTVLICASNKELIDDGTRLNWVKETFKLDDRVVVKIFAYDESELTNSSVSSREISKQWASIFEEIVPDHTLLVTSEPYGEYVAEYMNITHIPFDYERIRFNISSSSINSDLKKNWNYLPGAVKRYFAKKVVILGTESTGKTTLASGLAAYFNATLVSEAGRELIEDSNDFSIDDLYKVAKHHASSIHKSTVEGSLLLIIDTDIHITQSYARYFFHQQLELDQFVYEQNKADLYLYLNNDVPFVQDGTRLDEAERNKLDLSHRATLNNYGVSYKEIIGDWNSRFKQAVELVGTLLSEPVIVRED